MASRLTSSRSRAFTMIEVIVVVVIVGILAAAIVPRMMSPAGFEVQATAEAAGDLLSVAARRESLSNQHVMIEFDAELGRLRLMTLMKGESGANGDVTGEWRADSLAATVSMGAVVLRSAESDGAPQDSRVWRVEFVPGMHRPSLDLVMADAKGKISWRVMLPSTADHAVVQPADMAGRPMDNSIDLDAGGAGSTAW